MYNVTRILHLTPGVEPAQIADDIQRLITDAEPSQYVTGPTLPGTINGGDVIIRLAYADRDAWLPHQAALDSAVDALPTTQVDGVEYASTNSGIREGYQGDGEIYRTLLMKAAGPEEAMAQFAADTLSMPRYVNSMVAWGLSTVDRAIGPTPWTHVWEQEYRNLEGLLGEYMMHPVHWAQVDRWFDPEFPDMVVGRPICHTYCASEGKSVLA